MNVKGKFYHADTKGMMLWIWNGRKWMQWQGSEPTLAAKVAAAKGLGYKRVPRLQAEVMGLKP